MTLDGNTVTLTLSTAVTKDQSVTLSYVQPELNPIRDVTRNAAAAFANLEVANATDNTAPTVVVANPLENQTAMVDVAFSYTFAAATFADADNDALTYTAAQAGSNRLPAWLDLDARTFSGIPRSADVGTLLVRVTADDGKRGTISTTFSLGVAPNVPGMPDDFSVAAGNTQLTLMWSAPARDGGSPDHPLRVPPRHRWREQR